MAPADSSPPIFLTSGTLGNVWLAMAAGIAAAAAFSVFVGFLALRRVGIYFAMITLAFGELSYFLENSPLSKWTGGENGLPGVPAPSIHIGRVSATVLPAAGRAINWCAGFFFVGFVFARFVVLSPVGSVLTAIRQNPERTAALGHDVPAYKLAVFVARRRVCRLPAAPCSASSRAICHLTPLRWIPRASLSSRR